MSVPPEPINPQGAHHPHVPHHGHETHHRHESHPSHAAHHLSGGRQTIQQNAQSAQHPANIDALISTAQQEFPNAGIRVTGRGRTVERQAELMSQRRRQNRNQFLATYRAAPHITEMDNWVSNHPVATEQETTRAFTDIINRARQNGAVVSNHLSDHARDISIPHGDSQIRQQVRDRIQQLGGHVIDEHDAVGGPHWHVDF